MSDIELLRVLRDTLAGMAGKAQFVSLLYNSKGTGELARHTIIIGAKYQTILEKSMLELELMKPVFEVLTGHNRDLKLQAYTEVLASVQKSLGCVLSGEKNPDYTCADVYLPIVNGLKLSMNDGSLHIYGQQEKKLVITPGEYKTVKSRPLTVEKDLIRDALPLSKFRQYKVDKKYLDRIKLNGLTLEFDDYIPVQVTH